MPHLLRNALLGVTIGLMAAMISPIRLIEPKIYFVLSLALLASLVDAFQSIREQRYSDGAVMRVTALNVIIAVTLIMTGERVGVDVTTAILTIFGLRIYWRLLKFFQGL